MLLGELATYVSYLDIDLWNVVRAKKYTDLQTTLWTTALLHDMHAGPN